ncbi:MAG: hypothetical protein HHJ09_15495 [Glaciimonas sp.]|nr:hypothetical protein [Glaciimonas sp.]
MDSTGDNATSFLRMHISGTASFKDAAFLEAMFKGAFRLVRASLQPVAAKLSAPENASVQKFFIAL